MAKMRQKALERLYKAGVLERIKLISGKRVKLVFGGLMGNALPGLLFQYLVIIYHAGCRYFAHT